MGTCDCREVERIFWSCTIGIFYFLVFSAA